MRQEKNVEEKERGGAMQEIDLTLDPALAVKRDEVVEKVLVTLDPPVYDRPKVIEALSKDLRTKLEEASMWLGKDLARLGTSNPYPEGKNPSNTLIHPTADGLRH